MGGLNIVVVGLGIVLIVVGYLRARLPWQRYQQLREQEANVARYEAWRGGLRDHSPTGASVMIALYRRQAQVGAAISIAGVVLILVGLAIR